LRLAIIPARGGSKRIPRKNIKEFCGKPIIGWSIEAAIKCECFDTILVSTDDEEIAEISLSYGAQCPFIRPSELSDDYTTTMDVVRHAIEWVCRREDKASEVCCLYPTAPFVSVKSLQQGLDILMETDSDFVIPVTTYAFPIQRAVLISSSNQVEMFNPDQFNTRSQDLVEAYHDAGQFYWGKAAAWIEKETIFSGVSTPLILPRYEVQDIDTLEDWVYAEKMFNVRS